MQPQDEIYNRRQRMVDEQLIARGIQDPRVLAAMGEVPREEFVPADLRGMAYDDNPLPIGMGQTISQPFTVAFMCQALGLKGDEKVLEIGTGSGYGAAVLSRQARQVISIERHSNLAESARERLNRLGYRNVQIISGDGTLGFPDEAPFDGIVVTAGSQSLPQAFLDQLAEGGRLIIPLGSQYYGQTLYRFLRRDGRLSIDNLGGFVFVPLVSCR